MADETPEGHFEYPDLDDVRWYENGRKITVDGTTKTQQHDGIVDWLEQHEIRHLRIVQSWTDLPANDPDKTDDRTGNERVALVRDDDALVRDTGTDWRIIGGRGSDANPLPSVHTEGVSDIRIADPTVAGDIQDKLDAPSSDVGGTVIVHPDPDRAQDTDLPSGANQYEGASIAIDNKITIKKHHTRLVFTSGVELEPSADFADNYMIDTATSGVGEDELYGVTIEYPTLNPGRSVNGIRFDHVEDGEIHRPTILEVNDGIRFSGATIDIAVYHPHIRFFDNYGIRWDATATDDFTTECNIYGGRLRGDGDGGPGTCLGFISDANTQCESNKVDGTDLERASTAIELNGSQTKQNVVDARVEDQTVNNHVLQINNAQANRWDVQKLNPAKVFDESGRQQIGGAVGEIREWQHPVLSVSSAVESMFNQALDTNKWTNASSGGTLAVNDIRHGRVNLSTGGTSGNTAVLDTNQSNIFDFAGPLHCLSNLFVAENTAMEVRVGFVADASNYVLAEFDPSENGNWRLVTASGGTESSADTGVAVGTTGNGYRLRLLLESGAAQLAVTNVKSAARGRASVGTNIPSGACGGQAKVTTNEAVDKNAYVRYLGFADAGPPML